MKTVIHELAGQRIAEVTPTGQIIIRTAQDALDLMMNVSYGDQAQKLVLHQASLSPDFFELKTRLAGEILQKVVNYRMQLAIVGDFSRIESESLRAFITESNRGRQIFFVDSLEAAKRVLSEKDL